MAKDRPSRFRPLTLRLLNAPARAHTLFLCNCRFAGTMTKNKVERSCRFETVTTQSTFTMGTQYSNRLLSPAAFFIVGKNDFRVFR
ncbi:hypothetical protein EFO71_14565 [Lacticaseibacillus rhamnosus]|nr:hypothetical protein [Lacticaseibacillus rhamnosus]MCT3185389.1 hypothetical protein [Lacticaseibacillus rhamnosus]MCT4448673.1 hypothetical protein [Lacticaseibacillus rhamnosus]